MSIVQFIEQVLETPSSQKIFETMWKTCKINYENGTVAPIRLRHYKSNAKVLTINKKMSVPNGTYSYLIEIHKGKSNPYVLKLGKFENTLELCIKHFQLRSNSPGTHVLVAGECIIDETDITYNLFSGTYTLPIQRNLANTLQLNKNYINNSMKLLCNVVFSNFLGKQGIYTNKVLFNNSPVKFSNLPANTTRNRITLPRQYVQKIRANAPKGMKQKVESNARQKMYNKLALV